MAEALTQDHHQTEMDEMEDTRMKLGRTESLTGEDDPVLFNLNQAERNYRKIKANSEKQSADLYETQSRLTQAVETNRNLTQSLQNTQTQVEYERKIGNQQRERAEHLATLLKEIHQSLFSGNVYNLILRACLSITGATRGLYVTARKDNPDDLRVRAALDVDGYPDSPPSDFIRALCHKVLKENDSFVTNDDNEWDGLPKPSRQGESFESLIAAPVVLLSTLSGIVIVADKHNGNFDEGDVEVLLSVGDQASVAVQNSRLQQELQNIYLSTITMLADVVEAKDPYTRGHCDLVSRYARRIASQLGLTERDLSIICYAALLHDVGKIGVSDGILNKPGPLLPEERELVKAHVRVGHDLLSHVPALVDVAKVVLHHHERWDGAGYPAGLQGDQIPIAARIVCVVDSYCAMITKRSYKDAYAEDYARTELQRSAGSQFDPQVVEAFLGILDTDEVDEVDEFLQCGIMPDLSKFLPSKDGVHAH